LKAPGGRRRPAPARHEEELPVGRARAGSDLAVAGLDRLLEDAGRGVHDPHGLLAGGDDAAAVGCEDERVAAGHVPGGVAPRGREAEAAVWLDAVERRREHGRRRRGRRSLDARRAAEREEGDERGDRYHEEDGPEAPSAGLARLEGSRELRAVLEASAGIGEESAGDEPAHPERSVGACLLERFEVALHGRVDDRHVAVAREGRTPGQALVEDRPEREDIRGRSDVLRVLELLGRHVAERAASHAGLRERDGRARSRSLAVEVLREAEVRDERHVVVAEEDVRRLEVAMDDPVRVGDAERAGESRRESHGLLDRERPAAELLLERASSEERHDEVGEPVARPRLEHRDEAFAERGEEAGLALEPRDGLRRRRAEDLDRDLGPVGAPGPEDGPHAAAAEDAEDAVGPYEPPLLRHFISRSMTAIRFFATVSSVLSAATALLQAAIAPS